MDPILEKLKEELEGKTIKSVRPAPGGFDPNRVEDSGIVIDLADGLSLAIRTEWYYGHSELSYSIDGNKIEPFEAPDEEE